MSLAGSKSLAALACLLSIACERPEDICAPAALGALLCLSGVARGLEPAIILTGPSVDPQALSAELDAIDPWLPLAAVRFSRAF